MTSKRRKRRLKGKRKELRKAALKTWAKLNYVPVTGSKSSQNWSLDSLIQSIIDVQPMSGLSFKQLYMNEWTVDERDSNTSTSTKNS